MITIRNANKGDQETIANFQLDMALETEDMKLGKPTVMKGVEAVLIDKSKGQYFVAEIDGKAVGSLLTTYEWSDWRNGTTLWIQSVFVNKNQRGKGVYKALYRKVKQMVEADSGYTGIRLYVYRENSRAKTVYSNLGMKGDEYEIFEWMK
ncbi:MAG: GNAT superfamily N-acetyltransferase [Cyclobacteriaceae bacterium]|jgi:GNAT superfamily N-acetyltransferase